MEFLSIISTLNKNADIKRRDFLFLPAKPDIPEIEYLSLATHLPHLCLDTSLTPHESDPNRWFFDAKHTQSKDDAKAKILKLTQCITTLPDDSSTKSYPFSVKDFKRLCSPQTWMKDTTVSTLMDRYNMICKKNCCNCCVRPGWSAKVIDSYYEMYASSKTNKNPSKIKESSAKLIERTNEHMKIDKENIPDCICVVQNIDDKHWILVCVCNIKTLN